MSDSKKWLTIAEAAAAAGITKEEVRRRANRIHAEAQYTIMGCSLASLQKMRRNGYAILGLTPAEPESLPLLAGSELKSLEGGRTVLNSEMVECWKRVEDHIMQLHSQGCRTTAQVAEELGVSHKEVTSAVKVIRKQAPAKTP